MKLIRLLPVAVAVAVIAVVAVPGSDASRNSPNRAAQECGRIEYTSGLEVVFSRFATEDSANALRDAVVRAGFANANVIPGCDGFRVVVRGIEDFDSAVTLQSEARTARFPATVECVSGKDDVGELEVVFGHGRDRNEALQLVSRAAVAGFVGLQLESDPCGGFEVELAGFSSRSEATAFVDEAKAAGFDAVIESS